MVTRSVGTRFCLRLSEQVQLIGRQCDNLVRRGQIINEYSVSAQRYFISVKQLHCLSIPSAAASWRAPSSLSFLVIMRCERGTPLRHPVLYFRDLCGGWHVVSRDLFLACDWLRRSVVDAVIV